MADTTVRMPARKGLAVHEIQEHIDALEALLKQGFSSSEDLKTALALFTDDNLHSQFEIFISVDFDKVSIMKVIKLIMKQLELWRKERNEMLSVN